MKCIPCLFGLITFVSGIKQEIFEIEQEKVQNLKKAANICADEFKLDPEIFSKISDGTIPSDETSNKYLLCYFQTIHVVGADGHAIVDKVSSYLGDHPLLDKFNEAIAKCNEVANGNPVETVIGVYRCYFDTSPVLYKY